MQIKIRTLLLALPLLVTACSDVPDLETKTKVETIPVTVGAAQQLTIKPYSQMENDGVTVKWVVGDQIAMWAYNSAKTAVMEAQPFTLFHYNTTFASAKFTANIPVMGEDTYDYYAVTPLPDEVNGTQAHYDIPATQNGADTLAYDVMVAQPVVGGALQKGNNSDVVSLNFTHKVHVLKIRIPANEMELPITSLTLRFPVAVTGRLTVDATNPTTPAQLAATEEGKLLTLKFTSPKGAGDTVFAVIAPVELTATDVIEIKAHSGKKESYPTQMAGKNYRAGHTTPISLTIPELYRFTRIHFSLDGDGISTLGEKVNSFKITGPEGCDLGAGSNQHTFTINEENKYQLAFVGIFDDKLSNEPFSVEFDSENTLTSSSFTMPQIDIDAITTVDALTIPALYFEDFSQIDTFDNNCDVGTGTGSSSVGNKDAISIANTNYSGWTAARVGGEANGCIRSACRFEGGGVGKATTYSTYPGRIDSAPIRGIKAGKSVRVSVSFNYVGGQDAWQMDSNANKGGTLGNPTLSYGYTTSTGAPNGGEGLSTTVGSNIKIENNQSWSNVTTNTASFTADGFTSAHRISWRVGVSRNGNNSSWSGIFGANGNHYLYIDNIRVSIAK